MTARAKDVDNQIIIHSLFYGQDKFADLIRNSAGLSILDLNIQNIFFQNLMNWHVSFSILIAPVQSVQDV